MGVVFLGHSSVSWNVFRLAGDFLHFGGMLLGLVAVFGARSVEGFSGKSQLLFLAVYVSRYLDMFTEVQGMYLMFFKITFNLITVTMLGAFAWLHETYDFSADSCNLVAIVAPTAAFAYVTSNGTGFQKEMWTFSEFLEPLALLPQYIVCYRSIRIRPAAVLYVLCVGGYRVFYVLNWIYKRAKWHGQYHDYTSWFGGLVECVLFFDFLIRISQRREVIGNMGASSLGRVILSIDDGAGRLSEKIELGVMGRRIPLGLTGHGSQEGDRKRKEWDVSDKMGDEEEHGLLTTLHGDIDEGGY